MLLSSVWAKEQEHDAHVAEPAHGSVELDHAKAEPDHASVPSEGHGVVNPDATAIGNSNDPHKEGRSLLNQAESLTERDDFPAAEIAYRRIMTDRHYVEPEQGDALLGLARMYRRQTTFVKAAAVYEKFLKLYSDDPRVPDALLELGRTQRAMGAYRNAVNKFYNVINSTLKLPPEGFEHYQLLAKTAQFEIAETHFETGNFTDAAKFFDRLRLLDLAPEDRARAHFKAAASLLNAGETEAASLKLAQYLKQWPTDANTPEARYLLALSLRKLGRTDEALRVTLSLLKDEQSNAAGDPKGWAYWQRRTGNQLANDFFQSGETLSAVAIYESLARLSDDVGWRLPIIYQTGLCYERLRQTDRAIKAYQEIVDANVKNQGGEISTEISELAKMAGWRIGQIEWSGQTEKQLHQFFSANLPATPAKASTTNHAPPNDTLASPSATPGSL
jgi:tetratricopeptide (TPR) repeat protein